MKKVSAAAAAALIALVATWEGLRTTAYQDIVGVWTICYGHTQGVQRGDKSTPGECKSQLVKELAVYADGVDRCITRNISEGERIALVSLAYNVGVSGVCKSTALRKMNAGDRQGGCDALLMWRYAGGKEVQGLLNRRKDERKVCLTL